MKGIVVWWPFEQGDIPHGWHECDGTLGTPDYRGRVLIGANATYVAGTTGGGIEHSHTCPDITRSFPLIAGDKIINSEPAGDFDQYCQLTPDVLTTRTVNHMPPWAAGYWIQKL